MGDICFVAYPVSLGMLWLLGWWRYGNFGHCIIFVSFDASSRLRIYLCKKITLAEEFREVLLD